MGDLTLDYERIQAAQLEADKNLREMSILHERTLKERNEYAEAVKRKEASLQRRRTERAAAISAYKNSEEYEETLACHFLDGFWYGDSQAHAAHPDWDFNLGTISLTNEVATPLSRARARKEKGGSRSGN